LQIDFAAREMTIKLVYYGPALSGKTTNLQSLHAQSEDANRGRLMTLETRDDRTLFFDLLPLTFKSDKAFSVRLKLFTVPGQVIHASTRRLVLQGADGVAFIADSQLSETQNNASAFRDLKTNLKSSSATELRDMPLVIQFNKRDLAHVRSDAELEDLARRGREPVFKGSAVHGQGVIESFFGLLELAWKKLDVEHDLTGKLHIRSDDFLARAAASLGYQGRERELADACVGGKKAPPPPSSRSGGGR